MGRISKCPRYVIDITRPDPIFLGELGVLLVWVLPDKLKR